VYDTSCKRNIQKTENVIGVDCKGWALVPGRSGDRLEPRHWCQCDVTGQGFGLEMGNAKEVAG